MFVSVYVCIQLFYKTLSTLLEKACLSHGNNAL